MARLPGRAGLIGACDLDRIDPVPPPEPGLPCGRLGVVCEVQRGCCPQYSVCGGEPHVVGCPAGFCCDDPDDLGGSGVMRYRTYQKQRPMPR